MRQLIVWGELGLLFVGGAVEGGTIGFSGVQQQQVAEQHRGCEMACAGRNLGQIRSLRPRKPS